MRKQLDQVLEDKDITLWFADEAHPFPRRKGWAVISDVGCSELLGAVAVPRRRRNSYHYAEVLHEVAHLEMWRWLGKSPAKQDDAEVCQLAIEIARQYGFHEDVLEHLEHDFAQQYAMQQERRGR